MILQDAMIGYDGKRDIYYVFSDGKQVEVKGDLAFYRASLLFERAIDKVKRQREGRA